MAGTKPTAPLRDRKLSPSTSPLHHSSASCLTRPSPPAPLSRGTTTSPPALSKNTVPNYLKPKASPLSEPPKRPSSVTSTTIATTSKTLPARRPADKALLSSTGALQRSSKPASPIPRPSSSSRLNGDKVASRVTRSPRNCPFPKSKSTSPVPIKKKEATATVAVASSGKLSSDQKFDMGIERTEQEVLMSKPEKVVETSNELKNVEVALYVSPKVEGDIHIEEWKGSEPVHLGDGPETQMHNEIPKETVVLKEILKQAGMAVATSAGEKRDEGKIGDAKVEVASRRVEPEARKPRLGVAVATVVAATPMKKKDTPVSNDVIEETKSKLMGTRKNRVLALVGAFETVISLHEPEVQQNQKAYPLQQDQQIQQCQKVEVSLENQPSQGQDDQQIQLGQNEDSLENQRTPAQQEEQIQQVQQIGESLENQQDQQDYEAKNDEQLEGGDEVHQDQQSQANDQHQEKEEGMDALLKEEEEAEVSMLKEEVVVENAMLIEEELMEEEADDAPVLESSKAELQKFSVEST